jgi:hypothetical protein
MLPKLLPSTLELKFNNWSHISEVPCALYPLQDHMLFNPAHKFWFPIALTDEVLFHALLYVSAPFHVSQWWQ